MTVNLKYHEIMEEDLVVELEWLKEEFEILFNTKNEKLSQLDKKTANEILDYFLENTDVEGNIALFNLLNEELESIEKSYPISTN